MLRTGTLSYWLVYFTIITHKQIRHSDSILGITEEKLLEVVDLTFLNLKNCKLAGK